MLWNLHTKCSQCTELYKHMGVIIGTQSVPMKLSGHSITVVFFKCVLALNGFFLWITMCLQVNHTNFIVVDEKLSSRRKKFKGLFKLQKISFNLLYKTTQNTNNRYSLWIYDAGFTLKKMDWHMVSLVTLKSAWQMRAYPRSADRLMVANDLHNTVPESSYQLNNTYIWFYWTNFHLQPCPHSLMGQKRIGSIKIGTHSLFLAL